MGFPHFYLREGIVYRRKIIRKKLKSILASYVMIWRFYSWLMILIIFLLIPLLVYVRNHSNTDYFHICLFFAYTLLEQKLKRKWDFKRKYGSLHYVKPKFPIKLVQVDDNHLFSFYIFERYTNHEFSNLWF